MKILFLSVLIIILYCSSYAQNLTIYPIPNEFLYAYHNDDFTVRARVPGGEWKDLFEYSVKVDLDKPQDASVVAFDFSGKIELAIKKNNGDFQQVKVRPDRSGRKVSRIGKIVYFTIDRPMNLSVEFDGDTRHNLHVFANPVDEFKYNPSDTTVIYFGPGVHKPSDQPGDSFNIPSNKTVYLAPGAVLRGKLVCNRVSNVRILGRGILDQTQRGIEITNSDHITIDGLMVFNPKHYTVYGGSSHHISIHNLKSFSANGWSDGIDLMSCSDVILDGLFMRNSDDCIAIYAHRWDFYGSVRNIVVKNSLLWADVAHPIHIGLHGNDNKSPEKIEHLKFENIDILGQDEDDPVYQGTMAISAGDYNEVNDVLFKDIRIDDIEEGKLFSIKIVYNDKYNSGPGKGISNIRFKNITYQGEIPNPSVVAGWSQNCGVNDIVIDGLYINGKKMTSTKDANIIVGPYAGKIQFKSVP